MSCAAVSPQFCHLCSSGPLYVCDWQWPVTLAPQNQTTRLIASYALSSLSLCSKTAAFYSSSVPVTSYCICLPVCISSWLPKFARTSTLSLGQFFRILSLLPEAQTSYRLLVKLYASWYHLPFRSMQLPPCLTSAWLIFHKPGVRMLSGQIISYQLNLLCNCAVTTFLKVLFF